MYLSHYTKKLVYIHTLQYILYTSCTFICTPYRIHDIAYNTCMYISHTSSSSLKILRTPTVTCTFSGTWNTSGTMPLAWDYRTCANSQNVRTTTVVCVNRSWINCSTATFVQCSIHIHLNYNMKCIGIVHTHKLGWQEFKDFQDILFLWTCLAMCL